MSSPDPLANEELKSKLLAGDKIGTIKLYRELTNVGLAEAKAAVEQLQTRLRGFESAELALPKSPGSAATPPSSATINEAIFAGKKIAAIKLYRAQHQTDLVAAKRAVEEIEKQLRAAAPGLFAKPPASQSCLFASALVVVLILTLWKIFAKGL